MARSPSANGSGSARRRSAARIRAEPDGAERWNGPYLRKTVIPKDPWGRDYRCWVPGRHGPYDLFLLGSDGTEGGEGHKADIVSWK